MKTQRPPTLSGISYRVGAVDGELGLVLLHLDFGPASGFGPGERWPHPWEAFKVYAGEIHAAEAFMRGSGPHASRLVVRLRSFPALGEDAARVVRLPQRDWLDHFKFAKD
jgi:hypothetical protein